MIFIKHKRLKRSYDELLLNVATFDWSELTHFITVERERRLNQY